MTLQRVRERCGVEILRLAVHTRTIGSAERAVKRPS
jgi:hypothetical protein